MTMATGSDAIGRQTAVFLSLISPWGADRRLVLALTAISTVAFLSLLPVAGAPLDAIPGLGPAFLSSLLLCTLATAAVLDGESAKVAAAVRHGRVAPDARGKPFYEIGLPKGLRDALSEATVAR